MTPIASRPTAIYRGKPVTILAKRWPNQYEWGAYYEIELENKRVKRNIPEKHLEFPVQEACKLELVV